MDSSLHCQYPSSSSARISTTSASTTDFSIQAPSPSRLNSLPVRGTPSSSDLHLDELQLAKFTTPSLLPSMMDLVARSFIEPALESGSRSNSGSTSVSTQLDFPLTSAEPEKIDMPPSVRLTRALEKAADCVSRHSVLKWGQQIRDKTVLETLGPSFSGTPIEVINSYALEVSLMPLQFDAYRCVSRNTFNEPIATSIAEIIRSDDPDKTAFQMEVFQTHGDVLDSLFAPDISYQNPERRELLAAAVREEPEALERLKSEFELMVNYLPDHRCEKVLFAEQDRLDFDSPDLLHGGQATVITIRLLIDAMQKINPRTEHYRRLHNLRYAQADMLQSRALILLKQNNWERGCELMLDAMEIFCRLKEKPRVAAIMLRLINTAEAGWYRDVLRFCDLAKTLCLAYPSDHCIYADFLFAMTEICYKVADYPTAQKLLQQALDDGISLPRTKQAQFLYRHICTDQLAGISIPVLIQRIRSALDYMRREYANDKPKNTSTPGKSADLSNGVFSFFHASLYNKLAVIAVGQLTQMVEKNSRQTENYVALLKSEVSLEEQLGQEISTVASLRFVKPASESPGYLIVHAIADYARNVLKLLAPVLSDPSIQDRAVPSFISSFGMLVDLFLKTKNVARLKQLLAEENVKSFMDIEPFRSALPTWRNSLSKLIETVEKINKSEEDESSTHTPINPKTSP